MSRWRGGAWLSSSSSTASRLTSAKGRDRADAMTPGSHRSASAGHSRAW